MSIATPIFSLMEGDLQPSNLLGTCVLWVSYSRLSIIAMA